MGYPAPKRRHWQVQIEFHDGTIIDATSDDDAIERWRRLAAWSDTTAETDPDAWMDRVLDRARVFYEAELLGVVGAAPASVILNSLAAEGCLMLRRK